MATLEGDTMKSMLNKRCCLRAAVGVVILTAIIAGLPPVIAAETATPTHIKVEIGNRMYPAFHETVEVEMNKKISIGDTDYLFEMIEFYPHFAITDSTKKVVTLSEEPTNPAFKIRVYQNEETVEDTWAFYGITVPHYARTSYLTFSVLEFEYRGTVLSKKEEAEKEEEEETNEGSSEIH